MPTDFITAERKHRFLEADYYYRKNVLTERDFAEITFQILLELLDRYQKIQPYFQEFEKAAEEQWETAKKQPSFLQKEEKLSIAQNTPLIEQLKKHYVSADLEYRSGKTIIISFNKSVVYVLTKLLDSMGRIQPYFRQFEQAAQEQWDHIQNQTFQTQKQ